MSKALRKILFYWLAGALGILGAAGIACLVGLKWPNAKPTVFWILAIYWMWRLWRHASIKDAQRKMKPPESGPGDF
ncbi:MAG: hypothetical protein ABSA97_03410 [Verrucomicrobiia bacterium]